MESGSDYSDEIQSPDEDADEIKENSNNGDEEMDVSDDGENADNDNGMGQGDEEQSVNDKEKVEQAMENEDNSLADSCQLRSPSIAHSNISEEEPFDSNILPDSKIIEEVTPVEEGKSHHLKPINAEVDCLNDDSEDSVKGMNDEDKSTSYHSSPPESPSPPHSPDDEYDKGRDGDNQNHAVCGSRSPKQSLEDQDGELDFEEELPERKEDCDSNGERLNSFDKLEAINVKRGENEMEDGEEEGEEREEKEEKKKKSDKPDDADDDDGEVEDDDDLEEGEVKDGSAVRKVLQRPMCRFFVKGQCTWGTNCRFLHPGVNDKGNYNMFAPPKPLVPSNGPGMAGPGFGWHGGGARISPPYHGRVFGESIIPPPPPAFEEPAFESAWERGLRHAKEILKKSSKRKEMEPDFEEKRMNLSLGGGEGSNEYEKENDYYNRSPYRSNADSFDPYGYDEPVLDPYERQAHDYWRGGNYENFEVRYTRTDYDYRDHDRLRERERIDRARERDREREQIFRERERERDPRSRRDKFERPPHSPERNWREERYIDPQIPTRARGDEWRDPWRRSTSPKRRNHSRSFSSHSSASYSSSRSSGSGSSSYSSRSRSSSGSSHSSYSSRSYIHSRSSHSKMVKNKAFVSGTGQGPPPTNLGTVVRKAKPQQQQQSDNLPVPSKVPRPLLEKKVVLRPVQPPAVPQVLPPPVVEGKKVLEKPTQPKVPATRMRSISSSGSESISSRSRSRVEKSFDAWPQRKNRKSSRSVSSGSRSSSISSLESVSSKSSLSSKSSADSELEVVARELPKKEEKPKKEKLKMKVLDPGWKSSFERIRPSKADTQAADMHVKSLVSSPRTSKDPLKQSGQKTQIKLTLLNKDKVLSTQSALTVRKDNVGSGDMRKPRQPQPAAQEKEVSKPAKAVPPPTSVTVGKKRPLPVSPKHEEGQGDTTTSTALKVSSSTSTASRSSVAPNKSPALSLSVAAAAAQLKKSTSSRREELLKQLKAVEDAIARKRAKMA